MGMFHPYHLKALVEFYPVDSHSLIQSDATNPHEAEILRGQGHTSIIEHTGNFNCADVQVLRHS